MNFINVLDTFNWCSADGGLVKVLSLIIKIINIIRIAVPIALIIWCMIDIFNSMTNPDNKDTKKKISERIITAIIVFLVPTIVNLVMDLVSVGNGGTTETGVKFNATECWVNAKNK